MVKSRILSQEKKKNEMERIYFKEFIHCSLEALWLLCESPTYLAFVSNSTLFLVGFMAFVQISYLPHFCFQFDSLTLDMTKTQNSCLSTGACANKSLSIKAWKYI
jgi:hypothetical protein